MYDVIIALIPAFAMAVYTFGVRALILTAVSVLTCILTEYLCQKALKRDIEAFDGSAILTGILFSFVVPVIMPLQYVVVGNIVAITLGKIYRQIGNTQGNPIRHLRQSNLLRTCRTTYGATVLKGLGYDISIFTTTCLGQLAFLLGLLA